MTREEYLATPMPYRMEDEALARECAAIIESWNMPAVRFRVKGNYATVTHPGGEFRCMRWDLTQRLNELAVAQF